MPGGLLVRALLIALLLPAAGLARAETIQVAVAANFRGTLDALVLAFEAAADHEVAVISGSTGLLYAQVRNGAPFDLFLAADQQRPQLLGADGFGEPAGIFTYARGRLALWSADPNLLASGDLTRVLEGGFRWLAIAEPRVAPYGIAARQTLEQIGMWQSVQSRLVKGQNVAQAFAMVDTGNAELGIVALSQVIAHDEQPAFVPVPARMHGGIRQDAIVLNHGASSAAVEQFVRFLRSKEAVEIVEQHGYEVDPNEH